MWIFTKDGFYSAVEWKHKDEHLGLICIRARAQGDLDRLRKLMPEMSAPVMVTPEGDYRYRVWIDKVAFARGLAQVAGQVDYANFKTEVQKSLGHKRAGPLHEVWTIMGRLQKGGPYGWRSRKHKPLAGLPAGYLDDEDTAEDTLFGRWEVVPTEDGGLMSVDRYASDDYLDDRLREAFDPVTVTEVRSYQRGGKRVKGYRQVRRRRRA